MPEQTMHACKALPGCRDGASSAARVGASADVETITRHFRENCPLLLDGAPRAAGGCGLPLRSARQSLLGGRRDPSLLPPEILRETLDAVTAAAPRNNTAAAKTAAGLTAVGPKHARIWWDASVLDNLDDVLARLDKPRAVLRFYDVTGLDPESGRWNEAFDIDVSLADHGYTAQLVRDAARYVVDLGYIYADGRFLRLARTNPAALPRGGRGAPDAGDAARCRIRARNRTAEALLVPDAGARAWAAARPDERGRDIEAEAALYMLYRAFLRDGPRALRRAPRLVRRDADVLEREYRERVRAREHVRAVTASPDAAAGAAMIVARLDVGRRPAALFPCRYLPAVAVRTTYAGAERFAWHEALMAAMRTRRFAPPSGVFAPRGDARTAVVRDMPVNDDLTASLFAAPVFEAAKELRGALTGMRRLNVTPVMNDSVEARRLPASGAREGRTWNGETEERPPERTFGGHEAKRMAKAGVRFTRMALTLEGRMRPGARLKVAGKLVHADAEGRFRLECVLSGKKASIPMRAGVSIGGEARSLINVEWEKCPARENRHVGQD